MNGEGFLVNNSRDNKYERGADWPQKKNLNIISIKSL
jgi:hypothetical protein